MRYQRLHLLSWTMFATSLSLISSSMRPNRETHHYDLYNDLCSAVLSPTPTPSCPPFNRPQSLPFPIPFSPCLVTRRCDNLPSTVPSYSARCQRRCRGAANVTVTKMGVHGVRHELQSGIQGEWGNERVGREWESSGGMLWSKKMVGRGGRRK